MTAHRHDFPAIEWSVPISGDTPSRCRLCTANDRDGVIEQLAADLWESRRNGHLDDRPWAEAGEYWQRTFREFAEAAVESLTSSPVS